MGWAAAIAALLEIFGPFLKDLLQKLLDRWLNKAAAMLSEPATFGSDADRDVALIEKALDVLPWIAPLKRRILLRMLPVAKSRTLDPETAEELAELATAARGGF